MEKYDKLYKIGTSLAVNYFNRNKNNFVLDGVTAKDLIQEAYLVILELLEKYKDKSEEELCKLTYSSVNRKFISLKRNSIQHCKKFIVNRDMLNEEGEVITFENSIDLINHLVKSNFNFTEILAVLTVDEYELVKYIIIHKRTLEDLTTVFNLSKSQLSKNYKKALSKIASYLDIDIESIV